MDFEFNGKYKSLTSLVWSDLPKFAVVTGVNGSGKTQLLELLETVIREPNRKEYRGNFQVRGATLRHDEVMRLSADGYSLTRMDPIGLGQIQDTIRGLWDRFKEWRDKRGTQQTNDSLHTLFLDVVKRLGKTASDVQEGEFTFAIPRTAIVRTGQIFNEQFSKICLMYHFRSIEHRASSKT